MTKRQIPIVMDFIRRSAKLLLNGKEPFVCRLRLTIVNVVVLCSMWVMFADQIRLAFCPPSADEVLAIINFVVWIVLMTELLLELLIRPDGFTILVNSEKAFSPRTVLYISSFHFVVEFVSLLAFVPEFLCVWTKNTSCSARVFFSFYNAALVKSIGPTRLDAAFGFAYFALIRLRVLGLVRHWKNMWISNTFIHQRWIRSKSKQRKGLLETILSNIVPQGRSSFLRSNNKQQHQRITPLDRSSITVATSVATNSISTDFSTTTNNTTSEQPNVVEVTTKNNNNNSNNNNTTTKAAQDAEERESALTNACNIGTALMVINSYRTLAIMWAITGLFPLFLCFMTALRNDCAYEMTNNLQNINLQTFNASDVSCAFLEASMIAWLAAVVSQNYGTTNYPFLLTLEITPDRCEFGRYKQTMVGLCEFFTTTNNINSNRTYHPNSRIISACSTWGMYAEKTITQDLETIAAVNEIRSGSVTVYSSSNIADFTSANSTIPTETIYSVRASFDQTISISSAAFSSLLLQIFLVTAVLGGLSALRRDAEVLVLGPLRRMLRIVAKYAKNPLVPPKVNRRRRRLTHSGRISSTDGSLSFSDDDSDGDSDSEDFALGSYETEQLITAVAKITDLLRKCWGVAGADIISTNLASREGALTEVFNPTVPGKSVYALFAFAAIGGFENAVKNLGGDIMPLINDIAAVLHGEVFRWGFGDSGQCNKNLGGAFLMVFRIGLVKDVIKKLEEATNVVFNTKSSEASAVLKRKKYRNRGNSGNSTGHPAHSGSLVSQSQSPTIYRKVDRSSTTKAMSLSLQSLPGITNFTDRAVIGMLKSYAGIYRDRKILGWNDDFRLGAGVGAFSINMIYGMDAGWAVEGAVGSEYKIDATYLSPHVNMASRMTSACKQYGVTILLSQAVQELMSDVAQSKLRHIDTVTVKGSSVKQKIYTYDARARGVDFFLYNRSDEQADFDAEHVSPNIWNNDQDLKAMRQHVTDEFLAEFRAGHKAYISGDWPTAIRRLEVANRMMVDTAFEEGYLESEFDAVQLSFGEDVQRAEEELRLENADGPSMYLVNFMKSYGGEAPKNWEGWHPPESDEAVRKAFDRMDKNIVAVVTGFIGHDKKGKITTLGRSGSDLSATQIGAALGVDEIQVWKDVDGILSSDPRVIPNAIPIGEVTFEEASELAYFGAQVLHPTAMQPAIRYSVPVRVKNSYNPSAVGSYIREKKSENRLVTAITFKRGIKLMDIRSTEMLGTYGFLAEVFKAFQKHKLSVDVLASSEVSISLTLDKNQKNEEIEGLMEDLRNCAEVSVEEKKSILTLITDVQRSSEVLATVFRVFSTENINVEMMSQGASKVNISFIVDDKDLERAAINLHKCFFEDKCSVEPFHKSEKAVVEAVLP